MSTTTMGPLYTGAERGTELPAPTPTWSEFLFEARPSGLPAGAKPIYDETLGACVGYSWEGVRGIWHIYDATGQVVGMEEAPLESPLLDPFDLVLIGTAFVKLIRGGFMAAQGLLAQRSATTLAKGFGQHLLPLLRSRLKGLSARKLKFTETTARHMANAGRRVPIHILHLAIKFGKLTPDPKGSGRLSVRDPYDSTGQTRPGVLTRDQDTGSDCPRIGLDHSSFHVLLSAACSTSRPTDCL